MSTLRRRLESVEERIAFQQYRESQRQFEGRSVDELSFFCSHGYWRENAGDELPDRGEFTVGGIKTVVTTEWEDRRKKAAD